MAAKASWTTGQPSVSVDQSGTLTATFSVSDAGKKQADVTVTLTADRALRLLWTAAPGAQPLADFQAWQEVG